MKRIFTAFATVLITGSILAQSPEAISYQAVIRDSNDQLVTNTQVGMQISILQGLDAGSASAVYEERHFPTTNANGLVNLEIGSGTIVSGDFASIDWANGNYYIKTETDLNGGSNYTISGTSQLLSVPYAFHAKSAESITGNVNETDPLFNSSLFYFPQSGSKGYRVLVSFSGGSDVNFSQASPIALRFQQATPIYPSQIRYINKKKVDVVVDIPWDAATGIYDIVINPNVLNPNIVEKAFTIDWFW